MVYRLMCQYLNVSCQLPGARCQVYIVVSVTDGSTISVCQSMFIGYVHRACTLVGTLVSQLMCQ
jgi:hypothetical protein